MNLNALNDFVAIASKLVPAKSKEDFQVFVMDTVQSSQNKMDALEVKLDAIETKLDTLIKTLLSVSGAGYDDSVESEIVPQLDAIESEVLAIADTIEPEMVTPQAGE